MPAIEQPTALLTMTACLVRDLNAAGLLSQATRKVVWNFIAEHRDALSEGGEGTTESRAALQMLEDIAPAADG